MNWLKKNLSTILLVTVLLVGIGLLLYPTVSDYWNSFHQSRAIMSYTENVSSINQEEYDRLLDEAKTFNQQVAENGINWNMTEEEVSVYKNILSVETTGIMGYIEIPKLDSRLSVYHTTEESVLQTGVGHIEGSSLPVGGKSTHTILSGHRGLPSAKLFSELDKLVEGDTFTLTILDETLTYEVDQIHVVEPTNLKELQIEEGEDLCTLVTCTPYGINTHRLLVRGHRVENDFSDVRVSADALQIETMIVAPLLAVPVLLILFTGMLITTRKKKGR